MADDDAVVKDPNDPMQRLSRAEAMEIVQKNRMKNLYAKEITTPQTPPPPASAAPAAASLDPDADPIDPVLDLSALTQIRAQGDSPQVISEEDLGKYMVKTKVMGQERMVPLSELRTSAQKTEAADEYLRAAREDARQLLEDATAKATAMAAAPAPVATTTATANPAEADTTIGTAIGSAMTEIFKGNETEAARLLTQAVLSARPVNQPGVVEAPNADQLAQAVEQKVMVRSALRQFAKDYPAIYADPIARRVADDFLGKATAGKPLEGFSEERVDEILHNTGESVLAWTRTLAGVPANGPATTRIDKETRKNEIDELPAAATRAVTEVPQPRTQSDVIAGMAAARQHRAQPT